MPGELSWQLCLFSLIATRGTVTRAQLSPWEEEEGMAALPLSLSRVAGIEMLSAMVQRATIWRSILLSH